MNEKNSVMGEYYVECIKQLLEGLEAQNIDHFLDHLAPNMCKQFGVEISNRVKELSRLKDEYKHDLMDAEKIIRSTKKTLENY